jgi:glycine cleavage system regulatory protein
VISDNQGNVEESKMNRMSDKFNIMMMALVSHPVDANPDIVYVLT